MRLASPILSVGFLTLLSLPLAAGAAPTVLAGWDFESLTNLPETTTDYGPLPSDVGCGSWSSTATSVASSRTVNLSSVPSLNNNPIFFLRLAMNGTARADGQPGSVASTGTSRIDNVSIEAEKIPVPAPLPLVGVAGAFATARRLRRRVRLQAPAA